MSACMGERIYLFNNGRRLSIVLHKSQSQQSAARAPLSPAQKKKKKRKERKENQLANLITGGFVIIVDTQFWDNPNGGKRAFEWNILRVIMARILRAF